MEESNTPLLPFGFGLSYTTFEISNLKLDRSVVDAKGSVTATVEVKNTGKVAGDEVVQLYTRTDGASVTRPVKELRAFKRVTLRPGQSKKVTFTLSMPQMAYYDLDMKLVVEPATVRVMVGNSSQNLPEEATFQIEGPTLKLRKRKVFFNKVKK